MKKLVLVAICLFFAASISYAQDTAATVSELTLTGDIIDNMCAGSHAADTAEFVKTHTKECAASPACAASGYSIFANGQLKKFDKDSSAKIEEFLKDPASKLQVVVVAKEVGGELSLVSVQNQ